MYNTIYCNVITAYINVDGKSRQSTNRHLDNIKKELRQQFGGKSRIIVIPVNNQETRIEYTGMELPIDIFS